MVCFGAYVSKGSFVVGVAATQGNALWPSLPSLMTIYTSRADIENLGAMGSLSVVGNCTNRLRRVLGHLRGVC